MDVLEGVVEQLNTLELLSPEDKIRSRVHRLFESLRVPIVEDDVTVEGVLKYVSTLTSDPVTSDPSISSSVENETTVQNASTVLRYVYSTAFDDFHVSNFEDYTMERLVRPDSHGVVILRNTFATILDKKYQRVVGNGFAGNKFPVDMGIDLTEIRATEMLLTINRINPQEASNCLDQMSATEEMVTPRIPRYLTITLKEIGDFLIYDRKWIGRANYFDLRGYNEKQFFMRKQEPTPPSHLYSYRCFLWEIKDVFRCFMMRSQVVLLVCNLCPTLPVQITIEDNIGFIVEEGYVELLELYKRRGYDLSNLRQEWTVRYDPEYTGNMSPQRLLFMKNICRDGSIYDFYVDNDIISLREFYLPATRVPGPYMVEIFHDLPAEVGPDEKRAFGHFNRYLGTEQKMGEWQLDLYREMLQRYKGMEDILDNGIQHLHSPSGQNVSPFLRLLLDAGAKVEDVSDLFYAASNPFIPAELFLEMCHAYPHQLSLRERLILASELESRYQEIEQKYGKNHVLHVPSSDLELFVRDRHAWERTQENDRPAEGSRVKENGKLDIIALVREKERKAKKRKENESAGKRMRDEDIDSPNASFVKTSSSSSQQRREPNLTHKRSQGLQESQRIHDSSQQRRQDSHSSTQDQRREDTKRQDTKRRMQEDSSSSSSSSSKSRESRDTQGTRGRSSNQRGGSKVLRRFA